MRNIKHIDIIQFLEEGSKNISQEEIDNQMPLIINPKPDTVIRIYMQFKVLPFPINVKEHQEILFLILMALIMDKMVVM